LALVGMGVGEGPVPRALILALIAPMRAARRRLILPLALSPAVGMGVGLPGPPSQGHLLAAFLFV
jgi:hypothetical protein